MVLSGFLDWLSQAQAPGPCLLFCQSEFIASVQYDEEANESGNEESPERKMFTKLMLRGKGMIGLVVHLKIEIPKEITKKEEELLLRAMKRRAKVVRTFREG